MSHDDHDADLREYFAALRREERRAAPPFHVPAWVRRSRPRRTLPVAASAVLVGGAAALLLWVGARGRPTESTLSGSLTAAAWISPTDFLLETPGRDLLRVVPDVVFDEMQGGASTLRNDRDSGTTKSGGRT